MLRSNKRIIPLCDCVLLCLKWLKWYESYARIGQPFGLSKSSVHDILLRFLPILLRWSEFYLVMKNEHELREVNIRVISDTRLRDYLFVVDSVPTRISNMSGPLARDFYNQHKKFPHIKTQAVVDMSGMFIHISPTVRKCQ